MNTKWAVDVLTILQIAAFVAGVYLGFKFSPWWFLICTPCVGSVIYGMKH